MPRKCHRPLWNSCFTYFTWHGWKTVQYFRGIFRILQDYPKFLSARISFTWFRKYINCYKEKSTIKNHSSLRNKDRIEKFCKRYIFSFFWSKLEINLILLCIWTVLKHYIIMEFFIVNNLKTWSNISVNNTKYILKFNITSFYVIILYIPVSTTQFFYKYWNTIDIWNFKILLLLLNKKPLFFWRKLN